MPPKTGAKLRLGGKIRTLRYTAPALGLAQDELDGQPLAQIVASLAQVSIRAITAMVWAGLLHEDPDLTVGEAAELIEPPLMSAVDAIIEALDPWIASEERAAGNAEAPAAKAKAKS